MDFNPAINSFDRFRCFSTKADNSKELSAFFVVGRLLTDGREGHLAAIVQRCTVHMVREDYVQASG